ncbi:MAG: formate dehydrogenase accessory sulfurtransferase FdhD [Acidothermaceae bacterium]
MGRVTERKRIVHLDGEAAAERFDTLVAEEPLEIRVGGTAIAVTMRTPGDDFDLVAGFTFTEGLVTAAEQLSAMRYCAGADADGRNTYNVIDVSLDGDAPPLGTSVSRNFYTTSSCGVCGKASIDAVRIRSSFDLHADDVTVAPAVLAMLPEKLRGAQKVFESTGGLHAAALFSPDGEMLALREDVGRHNAVDKVVGWAVREQRLPLSASVLMVSGRVSFELVQKAYVAGIPVLAAVSAPSTLAVEFADSVGLTLVGFLRGAAMNVYSCAARIQARVDA